MLTLDEAIRRLRADPDSQELVRDAYLGADVHDSGLRFEASAEFEEVRRLLGDVLTGATVMDVGAGAGIASFAFARAGAARVYAVEPDLSSEVGRGAIHRLVEGLPVQVLAAHGEGLPLPDEQVGIVYARQVLHHVRDLPRFLAECARVLRPGGVFLACREHVVDDEEQLKVFLERHPVHQLAGGENAYSLDTYVDAIRSSGLLLTQVMGPYDSVINAFPEIRSASEFANLPRRVLRQKLGPLGPVAAALPGVERWVWARLRRPTSVPGRVYSFLATKPPAKYQDVGSRAGLIGSGKPF
jgi:SAM-dependent methyltransferase